MWITECSIDQKLLKSTYSEGKIFFFAKAKETPFYCPCIVLFVCYRPATDFWITFHFIHYISVWISLPRYHNRDLKFHSFFYLWPIIVRIMLRSYCVISKVGHYFQLCFKLSWTKLEFVKILFPLTKTPFMYLCIHPSPVQFHPSPKYPGLHVQL